MVTAWEKAKESWRARRRARMPHDSEITSVDDTSHMGSANADFHAVVIENVTTDVSCF